MNAGLGRLERLLPWACLAAAAVLFASELMVLFELTPPGAEPLDEVIAREQHGNAMFVISTFAALLTFVAVWGASRPAALGVAVMGGIALLFFLLFDLPDAGQVGTLGDGAQSFIDAEAVPQAGFWLEMLGALALATAGTALATMSADQLAALKPGSKARSAKTRPNTGETSG